MLTHRCVIILLLNAAILLFGMKLNAQSIPYQGPSDEAGDPSAQRLGIMNGNRVEIQFSN